MATHNINVAALYSPSAANYFTHADRRVMIGLRATLGILGLPEPEYAHRRKPGRTPAKAVLAAYHADNPQPRSTTLASRKPNASPDVVASAIRARA